MRWGRWVAVGGLFLLLGMAAVVPAQAETAAAAGTVRDQATGQAAGLAREAGSGLATGRRQVQGLDRVRAVTASGDMYAALMGDGSVRVLGDLDGDGVLDMAPRNVDAACPVRSIAAGAGSLAMVCGDGSVMVATSIINTSRSNIKQVARLSSVKAVSLGRPGLIALRSDGTVWFAGFAIGEPGMPSAAEQVSGLAGITAIAAGIDDAVAVRADGTAYRLAIKEKGIPVKRLEGLPPVKGVAVCGPDDDCDGTDGYIFQTGDGRVITQVTAADGKPQVVTLGGPVCDPCMAAGHARTLLLSASGSIQMATVDATAKVTTQDVTWTGPRPKQVAAGRTLDMALAVDGTVWVWDAPTSIRQVEGLEGIREIAAGDDRACAVAGDGTVLCWGKGSAARTFVVPHVLETRQVAVTRDYWVTLQTDGSISVGRWPASGEITAEPVIHRDVAARAVGNCCRGHVIIMKLDGTVEEARIAIDEPGIRLTDFTPVQGLDQVIQVAGTESGYLAVRADGTVMAWGQGSTPAPVKDLAGAVSAACGSGACAVAMGDGSVRGIAIDETGVHIWGDPHVDEADGSTAVGGGGGGGSGGVIALRADGTVVTFSEKVGAARASGIVDGIAVAADARNNYVLRADGTVWRWRTGGF